MAGGSAPAAQDERPYTPRYGGFDVEKFKADLNRQDLADRIKMDYDRGVSLNVRGTPTIYLNGRELLPGKLPTEQDIRHEIDAALGSSGK